MTSTHFLELAEFSITFARLRAQFVGVPMTQIELWSTAIQHNEVTA
jgi:hypothetical protein